MRNSTIHAAPFAISPLIESRLKCRGNADYQAHAEAVAWSAGSPGNALPRVLCRVEKLAAQTLWEQASSEPSHAAATGVPRPVQLFQLTEVAGASWTA